MTKTTLATALILVLSGFSTVKASVSDFIEIIAHVESGDDSSKVGDHGDAIGNLQIHYVCWKDATDFDPTIGGTYQDCNNKDYSVKIIMAYWRRYAATALANNDYETLAKVWNGGPRGPQHQKTQAYWEKVKTAMEQ